MSREKELARIATLEKELSLLKKSIPEEDKTGSKQYEEMIIEFMNQGLTVKYDNINKYVNYYNNDGSWVVFQEIDNKRIYFSYWRLYVVFGSCFHANSNYFITLLESFVEKQMGLVGYTTYLGFRS